MLDPLGERRDLVRREFLAFAGHGLDVLLLRVVDREDQPAGGGIARHDDGTDFAALEDEVAGVEAQARLLLLRAMAGVAVLRQHRPDFLLEELALGRGRGRTLRGPEQGEQTKEESGKPRAHRHSI